MSVQLGRLETFICQHFIANRTEWTMFIVFQYESKFILHKTFAVFPFFRRPIVVLIPLARFRCVSRCRN